MQLHKDFSVDHLNERQREIALTIIKAASSHPEDLSGGGCMAFHDPKEWDNDYGQNSELIVCYDGGDLYYALSSDGCYAIDYEMKVRGSEKSGYEPMERVRVALEKLGLFMEECTGWYSAVYKI